MLEHSVLVGSSRLFSSLTSPTGLLSLWTLSRPQLSHSHLLSSIPSGRILQKEIFSLRLTLSGRSSSVQREGSPGYAFSLSSSPRSPPSLFQLIPDPLGRILIVSSSESSFSRSSESRRGGDTKENAPTINFREHEPASQTPRGT